MSGTPSGIGGRIDAALLNLPAFGVLRIEGGASALGTQRRFRAIGRRAPLGRDGVPEVSPFDKPLLLWRLMRLLPDVMAEPAYAPLRRFLARDADLRKRFQLAERLADLFDQYQV